MPAKSEKRYAMLSISGTNLIVELDRAMEVVRLVQDAEAVVWRKVGDNYVDCALPVYESGSECAIKVTLISEFDVIRYRTAGEAYKEERATK